MNNQQIYDVIVVGNGALGLSMAYTLAKRRLKVAIIGDAMRQGAATTAAGAMLAVFGEVTPTLFQNEYGYMKHKMAVRASKLWKGWMEELEDRSESKIRIADGTIIILNTRGSKMDDRNFEAIRQSLKEHDEPFEDLMPADIDWIDPYPGSRPSRAIFIPNEHAVNPSLLLQKLEESFVNHGGTIILDTCSRIERKVDRVNAIVLQSGERVFGNHIVLAAGVKTQELLNSVPDIAARIPKLISGYGIGALVATVDKTIPNSVIRTPNRAFACGQHVVPRQKGLVYVGASNFPMPGHTINPKISHIVNLLESIYRQFRWDLSQGQLNQLLIGNRPVSIDGYPLLGETDLDGLWMMTGTYRDGLTLSPYLAEEMTKLICGEKADDDLGLFKPVRPPIQPYSRNEVISEAVEHILASGYETDWQMPFGWEKVMKNNLLEYYEKLTNDLHPSYTPPADILVHASNDLTILKKVYTYYKAWSKENSALTYF